MAVRPAALLVERDLAATAPAPVPFHDAQGQAPYDPPKLPAVTAKLGIAQNLPLREYEFVCANTDRGVKVTLAGMTYASVLWVPGVSDGVYPDRDEYMDEVLALMRRVVGEVVEAGADYVQLDSPRYTHLVSEEGQENLRSVGLDTETWLVPDDKVMVLGLITTKEPQLMDADQLKGRIEEASRYVPVERLGLSPQCGFASTLPGNPVTFDDQRAKLELLGQVAHDVWG